MENVAEAVKTTKDIFHKYIVNAPDTEVSITIVSMDIAERSAVIVLSYRAQGATQWFSKSVHTRVTKDTIRWFTRLYPVKDEQGNPTGEHLSGYQKFLRTKNINIHTPATAFRFTCKNHSPDYYENPFKVSISEEYNSVNLMLVTMTNMRKIVDRNPVTGEENVRYVYKRRDDGTKLTLPRKHYRRIEMR